MRGGELSRMIQWWSGEYDGFDHMFSDDIVHSWFSLSSCMSLTCHYDFIYMSYKRHNFYIPRYRFHDEVSKLGTVGFHQWYLFWACLMEPNCTEVVRPRPKVLPIGCSIYKIQQTDLVSTTLVAVWLILKPIALDWGLQSEGHGGPSNGTNEKKNSRKNDLKYSRNFPDYLCELPVFLNINCLCWFHQIVSR